MTARRLTALEKRSSYGRGFLVGDLVRIAGQPAVWRVVWVSWTTVEVYHRPSLTRRSFFTVTDDPGQHVDLLIPVTPDGSVGPELDGAA